MMTTTEHGTLTVLCGPSGVGKSTVLAKLFQYRNNLYFSVSATTRAPRPGEKDGVDYLFVTKEHFESLIADNDLLEYAQFAGNYYGTPRSPAVVHMEKGEDVILDIEVNGARQVKERCPEAVLVFLAPPSMEELEHRLRGRGTENEATILRRLAAAKEQMDALPMFDYKIPSDTPDAACDRLCAIITAERYRIKK